MRSKQHLYDQCRTFGHAWFEVEGAYKPLFGVLFSLKCERCDTVRNDVYGQRGEVESRNYVYPEGYRESEKITKAEYRMRLMAARPKPRRRKSA